MEKRIERFEDLIAWQKARLMTREVYLTALQGKFVRDFVLSDQIRRAALSLDIGYLDEVSATSMISKAEEVGRILGGLRSAVARQRSPRYQRTPSSVLSPQS